MAINIFVGARRIAILLGGAAVSLATTLAQAAETTNTVGMTMVSIPAGSFMMGSCEEKKKRAFLVQAGHSMDCNNTDSATSGSETPQHHVSIKAFQMGKTEVTLGQFKKYIVATGRISLVDDDFMEHNAYGDNAPVVRVSWNDAQDFIAWLNTTAGRGYRLPSEAEWEYACRANNNDIYCGSNSLGSVGWFDDNSGNRQRDVAGKQANAFGLYDMSGNVWEWVQDCWHDNYNGAPSNGTAWASSCSGDQRGLRGGSWYSFDRNARAAYRFYFTPGYRYLNIGFRLARTLP